MQLPHAKLTMLIGLTAKKEGNENLVINERANALNVSSFCLVSE